MNDRKRKALEAAGYRIGDVSDFLGLSEEEWELVELRAAVSAAVRERRTKRNLTQAKLAELLQSSQSRVAKSRPGRATSRSTSCSAASSPWAAGQRTFSGCNRPAGPPAAVVRWPKRRRPLLRPVTDEGERDEGTEWVGSLCFRNRAKTPDTSVVFAKREISQCSSWPRKTSWQKQRGRSYRSC